MECVVRPPGYNRAAHVDVAVGRIMRDDARTASQSVLTTVVFPVPAFPSMNKGSGRCFWMASHIRSKMARCSLLNC